jgi:chromosome partitioning protein
MTHIIAFANQKGGVGKTTTAINIGASLAAIKKRVLLIDLDQQGNAGTGLGFERASHRQSVYGVIMGTANVADNILTTAVKGLHLLPSSQALAGADIDLLDMENREFRLRDALQPILPYYDYVLLDCPPALGFLTINALTAADSVLIPLQCEFLALEGVSDLIRNINIIKKNPVDIMTHVNYLCKCNSLEVAKAAADYGTYLELSAKKPHFTDEELMEMVEKTYSKAKE